MKLSSLARRRLLQLPVGMWLSSHCWPGACADDKGGKSFNFIVANDLHSLDKKCPPFFEKVIQSMREQKPEFIVLAGDLAENGTSEQLGVIKEIFTAPKIPLYVVPGNHDFTKDDSRKPYDDLFPNQLNHLLTIHGWQFLFLDTTQQQRHTNTEISKETFEFVEASLKKLDKKNPTVVCTHFPLGEKVNMRPKNAEELLKLFTEVNLKAVFSGHYHSQTEVKKGETILTTNRCCAISRSNHDGTKEKGYFHVTMKEGVLKREFVEVKS